MLQKAIGYTASAEGLSILPPEYRTVNFIAAIDLQKAPAAFAGLSTRSGETIRVEAKNIDCGAAAKVTTGIYTTLAYTAICSIRLTGVDVYD